MKHSVLLVALLFILSACEEPIGKEEATKLEVLDENKESEAVTLMKESNEENELQAPPDYISKKIDELSLEDSETAYALCMRALTDYYKAIWNGSEIDLGAFIQNENLKRYTETKINYHFDLFNKHNINDYPLEGVVDNQEVDWVVKFTDDNAGGYLYVNLPVEVKWDDQSGRGEATEFLVRNVNGKLVIVDWYTGGKDSYDFLVRGENEAVNNPEIWNNSEWAKQLDKKQHEFSGGIR